MSEQAQQAAISQGITIELVDIETRKAKISQLTVDEARAVAADMTAPLAGLQRRWESGGEPEALFGALIFFAGRLPEWLFKGLLQYHEKQLKNPHAIRFLAVLYAHDALGMTMDESYDWAADNVTDPTARGGRDSMMKSYQKIRPQVAKIDRIRPRRRARRGDVKK